MLFECSLYNRGTGRDHALRRNSDTCEHCGKTFVRLTGDTPIVNRSDGETFHVSLYSAPSSSLRRTVCIFVYAHDQIGPQNAFVSVIVRFPLRSPRKTAAKQIEELADKVSELVRSGKRIASSPYIFEKGQLRFALPGE
jgi:hypothetical protein